MTIDTNDTLKKAMQAVKDAGGSSTEYGGVMRRHWRQSMTALFEFSSDGRTISEGLSLTMDRMIIELANAVCDENTAILATGGYGRGRLAPFSDVDLLLLADGKDHEARLAPFMYALWDGGLPLSHATHTPASAATAATEDTVTRTSFLDARYLVGDKSLYDRFQDRFDKLRRRTLADFVEAKLRERDDRHDKMEASRYAIEPDIKEGKGGLRDLDTLHWLDRYVSGIHEGPSVEIDTPGLFNSREERRLRKISDFLWSTRVHLHDLAGRADEKLHFAIQPKIAKRLGFEDKGASKGVERFMRYYFLNAKEVGRLTGTACAQLEERALKETRLGRRVAGVVGRFAQETNFDGESNLVRRGGRLTFENTKDAERNLRDVFGLFRAAGKHDLPIHPDAIKTASRAARTMEPGHTDDKALAAVFRDILRESRHLADILRSMAECGILGRYLPPFGAVLGKVEYGLFRRFTIDEHILRSISVLNDMLFDRDDGRYKITKPMAKDLKDPVPLYLALLLQETPTDLAAEGRDAVENRIREYAAQVVETPAQVNLVVFTLMNRDLLFRTASRRSVTGDQLIANLCSKIQTEEQLSHLAILTSCRHRTAGLRSWEEYAKRDVRLLVQSIKSYLQDGKEGLTQFLEERRQGLRSQSRGMLTDTEVAKFDNFIDRTGPTFWSMVDVNTAADLALLVSKAEEAGDGVGVLVQSQPGGMLTVMMYMDDKPSAFAKCAGVVAEIGGTVWDASAFPLDCSEDAPKACLVLQVNKAGPPPGPFEVSADERDRIRQRFEDVVQGDGAPPRVPAPNIGDRRSVFRVDPIVREDSETSNEALIIEVETLDSPGLLYYLASALAEIGVSIQLAFVATYGHRAVDTFYLQDAPGYKITDERRIQTIKLQLLRTMNALA